ncbi:MAG TPA: HD domain-containing protein [Pirellulales bacterium]|nr:HD domain-containing protein [Pirellulales bacterium]
MNEMSCLLAAASFAAEKHRDQRRKDAEASPYINHPLAVAQLLAVDGAVVDIQLLSAALLHDTVEDTETSLEEVAERFGHETSMLVAEVTDDKSLRKEDRKRLQIENAPHKSDRAKMLKMADMTCNIRDVHSISPEQWDQDRKATYLNWAVKVADGCRGVHPKLDVLFDEAVAAARQRMKD